MGILFALSFLIEKVTAFIAQLKSCDSTKLKNGFEAKLTVTPSYNKSEECALNTISTSNETLE